MNKKRMDVLKILLDNEGQFFSGEKLSEIFAVSRTSIWKHIEELKKEGYAIEAVRKQGYRIIDKPDKLQVSTILPHLSSKWLGQNLHVYEQVESTQIKAHQLATEGAPHGTMVVADQQMGGKGRLGRPWHSPSGTGIWLSFIIRPDTPIRKAAQLTLLTAVAILRSLQKRTDVQIDIKWPNDLLVNKHKIVGILTELSAEADRVNYMILGIGINVNQEKQDFPEELIDVATSLFIESEQKWDRNQLLIDLIAEWESLYEHYVTNGFHSIKILWETYSCSLGKKIVANTMDGQYTGIATGITDEGVLLLKDDAGNIHKIYSADISV